MRGYQDVAAGLNPAKPIAGFDMAELMRLFANRIRTSIEHRSVDPLMDFIYAGVTAGSIHIAEVPIACAKGCSFCCRMWVDVTAPEAIFCVKHLTPERQRAALAAADAVCRANAGKSFIERCMPGNPPCSQLGPDGACTVYDSRPVACRTLVSSDAEECRRTFMEGDEAGFDAPEVWFTLRDSYNAALEGALIHSGLVYQARELNESLRLALTTPDAEQNWLAGADVFAGAPMSPADALFDQPLWRGIYQQAFGRPPPPLAR